MAEFKIHWASFFIALAIGMLYVYIKTPTPKVVIKYPNPDNAGKVIYQDEADNCYNYSANKTECPIKSSEKVPQPISV